MRFTEAFAKLGYKVAAPRTDWSASSEAGVCLSLWRTEIDWPSLTFDTEINANPPETWNAAGNNRRKLHVAEALERHNGWIDVVVVDGIPGDGVEDANPWNVRQRMGRRWRILDFEPTVGHFKAAAVPDES